MRKVDRVDKVDNRVDKVDNRVDKVDKVDKGGEK